MVVRVVLQRKLKVFYARLKFNYFKPSHAFCLIIQSFQTRVNGHSASLVDFAKFTRALSFQARAFQRAHFETEGQKGMMFTFNKR